MSPESAPILDLAPDRETLEFLLKATEVANSSLDLDELLKRIAEVIREAMNYEILAILLLHEATQELRIRYAIGHQEDVVRNIRIPVGEGITGAAVAMRQPVLVKDVRADGRYIKVLDQVRSELAVPMIVKNRVIGVIDLQSPQIEHFSERHRVLLSLVGGRVATAIENARLYRSTLRHARTLATLAEIGREFSSILKLDDLLRKIAELVRRLMGYDAFNILLLDEQQSVLRYYLSVQHKGCVNEKNNFPVGQGIVGHAVAERRSLLIPDVTRDPRYICCNPAMRAELAVPLVAKDRVIGVIDLESTRRGFFTTRHLQAMEMLAPQIAIAIDNARLYEKVARDEARMERDLQAARELQASLLPPCVPDIAGMEICAHYEPARELGGDLYDLIEYNDHDNHLTAVGIFTGDVSGKGAPAALYAALSHGLIRTLANRRQAAGQLLSKLNKVLCERRIQARSLALCCAFLDVESRTLDVANAGLPHPILCRGGHLLPVRVEGVPLGLLENIQYEPASVQLQPGDVAIFYSDGISENFNAAGDEFGRRRLLGLINDHWRDSATEIVQAIFEAAREWSAGRPISDDRTVVVLKVRDGSAADGA